MQTLKDRPVGIAVLVASAALLIGTAPALADIVPASRTTTLTVSWMLYSSAGPSSSGGASDGTTSLDNYSNSIATDTSMQAGQASQTSYLTANGAYALVSGRGYQNASVMQPYTAQGNSSFIYVFNLTAPATLTIAGSLDRTSPYVPYGVIELYDSTNTRVYQAVGALGFTTTTPISATYFAAAGQYRFVVSAGNSGVPVGGPTGASSARAQLSIPSPATLPLVLAAGFAGRRRR